MPHFWISVLFFFAAVPLTAITALVTSVIPWDEMKIKHTWHDIPVNWETLGHPSAGSTIDLDVLLKPDQESALVDAISEISNPKHSRYRAFLSKEQVDELVRPSPESVQLVCAWLAHNGIPSSSISRTHGGTWLTVTDLRVTQASQLLGASYQLYRNIRTNETRIRTVGYSLPEVLHGHVQTVIPTNDFSSMEATLQTPHRRTFGPAPAPAQLQAASEKLGTVQSRQPPLYDPPDDPLVVVPPNLRWLYGTGTYVPSAIHPGQNNLAVVVDTLPRKQDLTVFMEQYQKADALKADFHVQNADGDPINVWEHPNQISNAAVQYATYIAFPTPLFAFRSVRTQDGLMDLLFHLNGVLPFPVTIGISFNYILEDDIQIDLANAICQQFIQFGLRGASVLVASGDNGVGPEDCYWFHAEFPSSCPWVTSVGGTQDKDNEIATPHSGGGFSNYFERPEYQEEAVSKFLGADSDPDRPHRGRYNPYGRGFPDISAQAYGCVIVRDGEFDIASGTACAVSTAAGIIALLNDYMISTLQADEEIREASLGFLNEWLYGPEVLGIEAINDITSGSNPGCGTTGFTAKKGWDPVTGLGTLNFQKLLYLVKERRFFSLTPTAVPTPGETVPELPLPTPA